MIFIKTNDDAKISELIISNEIKKDFIQWLFDDSGELDHITYQEAWDKFNIWLENGEK